MSEANPPPKKSKTGCILLTILVVLLGGGVLGVFVCCGGPVAMMGLIGVGVKQQQVDAEKKVQEQKPIEVTGNQLWTEFKENQVKANNTYKGNVVQVTGVVHRITQHEVEIEAGEALAKINCAFRGDDEKVLATLASGNQVTIKGICDGKAVFPGVNLSSCKLVSGGKAAQVDDTKKQPDQPNPDKSPIKLNASQLLSEYKDNEAKANNNYKGKTVQLTGTIKRITEKYVELKGTERFELITAECYFKDRNVMAGLTSGNEITITGVCEGKGIFGINIKACELVK